MLSHRCEKYEAQINKLKDELGSFQVTKHGMLLIFS